MSVLKRKHKQIQLYIVKKQNHKELLVGPTELKLESQKKIHSLFTALRLHSTDLHFDKLSSNKLRSQQPKNKGA